MKKLEIIIRQDRFEDVRLELIKAQCRGMTIFEVRGHGQQQGAVERYRGEEYKIPLVPKMKIDIIARDEDVEKYIDIIIKYAKTGEVGDGKIFISTIDDAIKIRTEERGIQTI
jgi:nitrogen regulatory protein P-II 1